MSKFPEDYRPNKLCMPSNVEKTFQSRFFYPNMCHVCHCLESETMKLKRCGNCNMISYCSKEHQFEHWYLHKDFCRVVSMLLKVNGTNNIFQFMKKIDDPNERFKEKAMLLTMLREKMNRDLYDFENQMMFHPRMCEVCFETNPNLLINCHHCPQGTFCTKHSNESQHSEVCFFYRICYTSDHYLFCDESCRIIPSMQNVPFNEEEHFEMPKNMLKFLQEYITEIPLAWKDLTKYDFWIYVCSEFFSKPLTMLYVLQQLNVKIQSELTVHVIGSAASMKDDFQSMETILHLLKQLKTLNIILISPNLTGRIEEISQQVNLCSRCLEKEKNFSMTGYKMSYSSYVNSRSFKSPDIIISYDLGDLKCQSLDRSLMEMKNIPAPLLVTNNTFSRAMNHQKRIDNLVNYLTSDVHIQKNPFNSAWAYRNEVDDSLNLHHNYFTVYTLHNIERDNQQQQRRSNQSSENIPEGATNENNGKVDEKCSNESNNVEDAPSALNSNQTVKASETEKSKKKKKKKKTYQSSDISNPLLSINDEAPETSSKIDETPRNDEQIVALTVQLSSASIQENPDAKSDPNLEKKKKKSKKKKSKSEVQNDSSTTTVQNTSESVQSTKKQDIKTEQTNIEKKIDTTTNEPKGNKEIKTEKTVEAKERTKSDAKVEKIEPKKEIETESKQLEVNQREKIEENREMKKEEGKSDAKVEKIEPKKEIETEEAESKKLEVNQREEIEENREMKKEEGKIETNEDNNSLKASEENKTEGREIKRKKKKKAKKQASTTKDNEPDGALNFQITVAHSKCVLNSSEELKSVIEESQSQYLFQHPPSEETLEQLVEENRRLFVNVEQIAEEYKMLKITGKQTATSMLQEMECLRMSLENIEEKIMTMFPGEFD